MIRFRNANAQKRTQAALLRALLRIIARSKDSPSLWLLVAMLTVPTSPVTPAPTGSQAEQALAEALRVGVLSQEEHDAKLRAVRGEGGLVVTPPTRDRGGQMVLDGRTHWKPCLGPFASHKEALQHRHEVVHGDNDGMWAANTKGCKQWLHCNYHVDCPVQLKACGSPGRVCLHVLEGVAHSVTRKTHKRKNQPLSNDARAALKGHIRMGKRPKQIMEDLTLEMAGAGAQKVEGGVGLEGASRLESSRIMRVSRPDTAYHARITI